MATYRDKLERIVKTVQDRTSLSGLVPGSKAYQLAEAQAYEQMLQQSSQEKWTKKNSIMSASGADLNEIAEEYFKVDRLDSIPPFISPSMKALKFYVEGGLTFGDINTVQISGADVVQDIGIPEGTIISGYRAGILYRFRVTENTILLKGDSSAYVAADLVQGPLDQIPSGVLKLHDFEDYSQNVNKLLKVTNPVPVNSGRKAETDDNYRYRVSTSLKTFPKTTAIAIQQLATSMPGVSNAFVETASNGGGTFTVYVQGTTPMTGDEIVEDVAMAIGQVVNPWQITYNVVKPSYVGISCSIEIILRDKFNSNITNLIASRVADLLNNFNGSVFYINSILGLVSALHPDIMDANFNSCRLYYGSDDIRSYEDFDFTADPNPVIALTVKEKLIAEPMTDPVLITTTV